MHSVDSVISVGDEHDILLCARISSDQANRDPKLLGYLIRQSHWSPFEMISANVQIETTRDIGRQVLRHRSFSFQELSGRYAENDAIYGKRDLRFKGITNRQGSRAPATEAEVEVVRDFSRRMADVGLACKALYDEMVAAGIATECARSILPEGLTPTFMCMNGTARSWIHYLRERLKLDPDGVPFAQLEHYWLAKQIERTLRERWPILFGSLDAIGYLDS